ncbi:unnamed protein product [Cylicocyclus nassatus]|uniref:Uncharacterized protein n=1 Tax=Cylicocyclus nassatus TaxID=53992 RepID=A0AA36H7C9_CYLNA|nr:unnamed protein product [Cylicocyclus nassatus]
MSQTGGRNEALKSLPEEIEDVLKDFGEDMLGFGHDELKPWMDVNLENSKFYKNLAKTDEEREKILDELMEQQKDWRPHLFRCLQMALYV